MEGNIQGGQKKNSGVLVGTIVAVIVAVAAYGFYKYTEKDEMVTPNPVVITPEIPTPSPVSSLTYKDGTYTATGHYNSPGGAETLLVSVTLKDDMVIDSTVTPQAFRPESKVKQADFTANYKTQVIGKDIDALNITKVSGSSLSPKGFMDALSQIKTQAKA